ncbi:MAG: peptidase T [Clostridia bacterium]|nr:peptidase T [Clostridia bacterium]
MKAYERLLRYTSFNTMSDSSSSTCPSTKPQTEFAHFLADELCALGVKASVDEYGYVYGHIPSNIEHSAPKVGFIAHLDTASDAPSDNVRPRIINDYDGQVITLDDGQLLSPEEFPVLKDYVGCDLIVTDGRTLLGADDKAGIAEIVTMAEYLTSHPEFKHGDIAIAFTPDEEIGRGTKHFDLQAFGADFAYTVDGGAFGQVEYENFNAASATVSITGRAIHPGSAKDKMINAISVAVELDAMLPYDARPQNTEMYEGFYHPTSIVGTVESAALKYILRDHDAEELEKKKAAVVRAASRLNEKYGGQIVSVRISDGYRNMADIVSRRPEILQLARRAVEAVGGTPVSEPIRGGTDGATLSYMGLPCPNLGTGSHNHHGRLEFACVQEMDKCSAMLLAIAGLAAEQNS